MVYHQDHHVGLPAACFQLICHQAGAAILSVEMGVSTGSLNPTQMTEALVFPSGPHLTVLGVGNLGRVPPFSAGRGLLRGGCLHHPPRLSLRNIPQAPLVLGGQTPN